MKSGVGLKERNRLKKERRDQNVRNWLFNREVAKSRRDKKPPALTVKHPDGTALPILEWAYLRKAYNRKLREKHG